MRVLRRLGPSGNATRWDLLKAIIYTELLIVPLNFLIVRPDFKVTIAVFAILGLSIFVVVGPIFNLMYPKRK